MIHYRDMTFCSAQDCKNTECHRNQLVIDKGHFQAVNLPISQADYKPSCGTYIGDNPPPVNSKAVA